MNRRGFLTSVAALAAGFVLDEVTGMLVPRKKVWQVPRDIRVQSTEWSSKDSGFHFEYVNFHPGPRQVTLPVFPFVSPFVSPLDRVAFQFVKKA
jgi:hypothetical protein